MRVEKDYEDLLQSFNKHNVEYCIIGSFAVAFYATPRYTKDIDVLINPTTSNAKNIVKALNDFGFSTLNLTAEDFKTEGTIIQLGFEPVRIDILTSISGISFSQIWKNKVTGIYGSEQVYFIGKDDLITTKLKANRDQDKADIKNLKK